MTKSEQLKRDAEFEITHPNDPDYGKKAYLFRMGKLGEYINAVIAERMPSEEEIETQAIIKMQRDTKDGRIGILIDGTYADVFIDASEWLRSRLTNPGVNDSPKTEGETK